MKVLVIVNSLEAGGAEKSAVKFACAVKFDLASHVDFATLRNSDKDFYELPSHIPVLKQFSRYSNADNISNRIIRVSLKPIFALIDIYKMRTTINRNGYDVVVSFGALAGCMTFLALYNKGIPQITSERIPPNPQVFKPQLLARLFRPYIYKQSVICSVQSKKVKEWIKLNWKIDSFITPNFFEISKRKYSSFPENGPVLTIGRPAYQKGYDLLISAWSNYQLNSERELWIVCDDTNDYVKALLIKSKIINAKLIKPQLELNSLFEKCSLFLSTSRFEGYPNAITEAMIYGLPVLTTNNSDVVQRFIEQNLCIEIKNTSKVALSAKLNEVLENQKLLRLTSNNGINAQPNFAWQTAREHWVEAINASIELNSK